MTMREFLRLRPAFFLALAVLMAGCTPMGIQPDQADTPEGALAIAESSGYSDTALRGLLSTAARYQDADRHKDARTILRSEAFDKAQGDTLNQYRLLAMGSIIALDDRGWAADFADALPVDQFSKYPDNRQTQAARLQTSTFEIVGQYLKAAQTLIASSPIRPNGGTLADNDRIWQLLKRAPDSQLNAAAQTAIGYEQQGWLELALSLRQPGVTLDTQGRTIRQWQKNWPDHPAANPLPSELRLIITLSEERPGHIALALPLSGPLAEAGQAIRDGFFAAFYEDDKRNEGTKTRIQVFDTNDQAFDALYDRIQQTKPDLIVGPLDKSALAKVADRTSLPTPVLALNYLEDGQSHPDQLYQYGLSAEDEARQIADRLMADDRTQAVALIPWGDWGDRVESALIQRMNQDGGKILNAVRYDPNENLRKTVADLFGIDQSRQRAITIEHTIAQNVEFEARRRQDIDAIVLVASPTIGRQFNPLFAFYFGGDLPVYSPSTIYTGQPDPSRDGDLERVRFTDIPWMLNPDNERRQRASAALPDVTQRYGRLFAMGMDAYALSSKLQLLSQVQGSDVDGLTGTLSMTPDGLVRREQGWAIFQKGVPAPLDEPVTDEPADETRQDAPSRDAAIDRTTPAPATSATAPTSE
ncbi:LppC family lipoprotein [Marinobacter sp. R17]|uniref:penicillin-binding protein activator n=1 Tax=Marinobacter sp. R17 TaxID=2484250 RepID=UPI000F4BCE43|nr:penicillin-binding protein activator [Marinobacter sp. R17]ROT96206.1 LppC family lipoprotein [Marinobacter sp. R17]